MKWLYTFIGSLFGFIIEMIFSFPQFVLDASSSILAYEGIANYPGVSLIISGIAPIIAFLMLPIFGGLSGYAIGSKRH